MQQKETLSAFIDGETVQGDFLEQLCNSPELQQKWANYHTIRSVMRGEAQLLGADFSAKMEALLENEEVERAPIVEAQEETAAPKGKLLKLKRWATPLLQAGIAASVCLIAVIGVNTFNSNADETAANEQPVLQTLPFTNAVQQVSYNIATQAKPTQSQIQEQQQRINELLQNHELQRRNNTNDVNSTSPAVQK